MFSVVSEEICLVTLREIYPNGIHNLLKLQIEDENTVVDTVT